MPITSVVIASVLKPIHDTRLSDKIAYSLAQSFPEAKIHILAHRSSQKPSNSAAQIQRQALFSFARLSYKRIGANFSLFKRLWQIKPNLLIVATMELIPAAVLYKWLRGLQLIYDVQENYQKNILFTGVYPSWMKYPLAGLVRTLELMSRPWIDAYWLAEDCYQTELPFPASRSWIIPNKFKKVQLEKWLTPNPPLTVQKGHFVYTGTISKPYGIYRAIQLVQALHQLDNQIKLTIVGYCIQKSEWNKIQAQVADKNYIQWIGGEEPVPHEEIIQAMLKAEIVLMPYYINRSVENRIPTKFYECLALRRPMLIQENPAWQGFFNQYTFTSALFTDFDNLHQIESLHARIRMTKFYAPATTLKNIYWEEEEKKLSESIRQIFTKSND